MRGGLTRQLTPRLQFQLRSSLSCHLGITLLFALLVCGPLGL
jgi:hypothetical protein